MKKTFTFYIFLLCIAFCQAQGPKFAAFQKKFLVQYCECLQEKPTLTAKAILYNKTDTCIKKIIVDNTDEFLELVNEFTLDEKMSGYEKGRYIGKLILFDGIDELVSDCPFYVSTMKRYIQEESSAIGATNEKFDTAISKFKQFETEAENDTQRNLCYQILGILYYMKKEYNDALIYFKKANDIKATTSTKGFIEMIKQYDLKEKK